MIGTILPDVVHRAMLPMAPAAVLRRAMLHMTFAAVYHLGFSIFTYDLDSLRTINVQTSAETI
jgi:hypothetical protein